MHSSGENSRKRKDDSNKSKRGRRRREPLDLELDGIVVVVVLGNDARVGHHDDDDDGGKRGAEHATITPIPVPILCAVASVGSRRSGDDGVRGSRPTGVPRI